MTSTNKEDAYIDDLEKLAGILNEASDKFDGLADSFDTSDEEFADIDFGKTDKEIAAQIAAPLVNALDSINAILNGAAGEVMEMPAEQGMTENCDSGLIAELKLYIKEHHKPAKNTAISFGLALKLKPEEFAAFLQTAGFALSYSSIFDLVIRFCVEREIYNLHYVNTLLLQADQKTLAKEAA